MSRALRRSSTVLAVLILLVALAGCGADKAKTGGAASADRSDAVTIDITIKDGAVRPTGSKVDVKAGKPIHLHIVSDQDGELHVHSSPEQEIEFKKGTTEKTVTIDQPGLVDVEIHELDKLVVQLQVS